MPDALRLRRSSAVRNPHGRQGLDPLWIVIAFAIASTVVRTYLAHRYFGFQTGDDVEIAEQAFRRAVGLFFYPWEVRNLLIPDLLVAPFVALGHALGVRDALSLAHAARYPFIVLAGANVPVVQPPWWYLANAPHWIPLTLLPGLIVALRTTEMRRGTANERRAAARR